MSHEEYGQLLNLLLECERAGAKLIAAYLDELPTDHPAQGWLAAIQRDEARNCSVLIHLLLEAGVEPTTAVGGFYEKGLRIRGLNERLAFLNRGQQWVADRIAAELPRVARFPGRDALKAMHDSHVANIAICEKRRQNPATSSAGNPPSRGRCSSGRSPVPAAASPAEPPSE